MFILNQNNVLILGQSTASSFLFLKMVTPSPHQELKYVEYDHSFIKRGVHYDINAGIFLKVSAIPLQYSVLVSTRSVLSPYALYLIPRVC